MSAASSAEPLARFDLRMRSLDGPEGDRWECSQCQGDAEWSVWLHTPEWMPAGGLTVVRCTPCALAVLAEHAQQAARPDARPCECGKPAPEDGGADGVCECCSTCGTPGGAA